MRWGKIGSRAIASVLLVAACFVDEGPPQATSSSSEASGSTGVSTGVSTMETTTETTAGTTTTGTPTETTDAPVGAPIFTCPDVPELVLCYEFETGWTDGLLLDTSDSLLHGTMLSTIRVPGHGGVAAELVGESRVFAPFKAAVIQRLLKGFTVAAWIRPTAEVYSGTRGVIEREGHIRLALVGGGEGYEVSCDSPKIDPSITTLNLAADEWVHVACIYDGKSLSVWVNGVMRDETSALIEQVGNDSLWIGNDGPSPGASSALIGLVDEVQIWSIALGQQALCGAAGIAECS